MPILKRPDVLAAIYQATSKLIERAAVPSTPVYQGHTMFRAVKTAHLPKPPAGQPVSRNLANAALAPRTVAEEAENRFSGPSGSASIPAASGLYCVLQQQALVNELMHYTKRPASTAFADRCVLKIRLGDRVNCVDISPHNPGHTRFLNELLNAPGVRQILATNAAPGRPVNLWREITDGNDCSVARGIGLAVANSTYAGLIAQTVRTSERSLEERGDNLILFGTAQTSISLLWIEEAWYFDQGANTVEIFPVAFP